MNEDVNSVSPTLGFIIKTIDYEGYVFLNKILDMDWSTRGRYKLNICDQPKSDGNSHTLIYSRGCRGPEDAPLILEELFWEDRCFDLGGWCNRPVEGWWLSGGITWAIAGRSELWEISISPTILIWSIAAFWSKLTRICEQNRREWLYGRGWDSRGTWPRWRVVEKKRRSANPLQGLQLNAIKTHKWHIIRCSAITGTNLQEGLAWVVQDAKSRLFLY